MKVISSREFREKQKSYFDQVDEGQELIVQRSKNRSYRIVPVTEDDTLMSKEKFLAQVERAIADVKEGKTYGMKHGESLDQFLVRMEEEGNV